MLPRAITLALSLLVLASGAFAQTPGGAVGGLPADPMNSPLWKDLAKRLLAGGEIRFDDRVRVIVPPIVENQAQVPVTVDARQVAHVTNLVVFADRNPIQHVLTLSPTDAAAYISFRMKVEQATPVRAAALDTAGIWHVGGVYLDAAGGGCSAPAMARQDADWSETVGQAQGRLWPDADGYVRARLRIRHPMDTGLAKDNTPAYFIEHVEVRGSSGAPLATLEMFEPVAEDPTLTLIPRLPAGDTAIEIEGRDNDGNIYRSKMSAPGRQSLLRRGGGAARKSSPC